jgi:hypothetical protein
MYEGHTYADLGYGQDVAPSTISLGDGWDDLESDGTFRFRRISNQAHALLASVGSVYAVTVDLEPTESGPDLELEGYVDGTLRCSKRIRGRSLVRFLMPPGEPAMRRLSLSVNRRARIFRFAALPFPRDVVPLWHGFRVGGGGWYPLEELEPDLFRYVNREADIVIERPERALELDVEPGPGVGCGPFKLDVLLGRGALLCALRIEHRTRITVALPELRDLPQRLVLRCEGGGRPKPPDARICDFRLFAVP